MEPQHPSSLCAHRVLEAAMEVFCKEGYRASIDAVSQRAGVARQTIYNNFGNKQQLFGEALRYSVINLFSVLVSTEGPLETRLLQFGLKFREVVLSEKSLQMQRLMISEAPRSPELAAGFHKIFMIHGHHQIADILEKFMQAGQLRQEDPTETAQAFLDMLVSAEKSRYMFGYEMPRTTPEAELQRTRHVVAAFLRAYATHSQTTQPVSSPEDCPIS